VAPDQPYACPLAYFYLNIPRPDDTAIPTPNVAANLIKEIKLLFIQKSSLTPLPFKD